MLAPRYADRAGGYTRIIKAGIRASDAAPMAIIEWSTATSPPRARTPARSQADEDIDDAA